MDEQKENLRQDKFAPLRKVTDWKEPIEVATKLGLTLAGVCYVAGLLILNIHLRQYGFFQLNFLQIEYMMAGALWMFLCAAFYFLYFQVINLRFFHDLKWKTSNDKVRGVLSVLGGVILALAGPSYVFSVLSGYTLPLFHWKTYLMIITMAFNVGITLKLADSIQNIIKEWMDGDTSRQSLKRARTYSIFYEAIILLTVISSYALVVYPKLSSAYGGGLKQKAEFIIKKDHWEFVKNIGISIEEENGRTIPLEVIFEAPDFFIISPPAGFDTRKTVESIRIRKDVIDAAYYLDNK